MNCSKQKLPLLKQASLAVLVLMKDALSYSFEGAFMNCPLMKIHLHKDMPAVLLHMSTARKFPMHYEDSSDKVLNELVNEQVIEPAGGPTEWCRLQPRCTKTRH